MIQTTKVGHRTVKVRDLDVFYREAGPNDAPTVLLLHGFPTSSQMFRNLIPALADCYRVLAPDYPGFGHSAMPSRDEFAYTFDNLAAVVEDFTAMLGLSTYALYVQDYGAPVGYRLAFRHPDRVTAIVVQNGNAYEAGLDNDFWKPLKAYWQEPTSLAKRNALRAFLNVEATRWQYTHGVPHPEFISPDGWTTDQYLLDRKGNDEIQLDLFLSYGSNPPLYPQWQEYFRKYQPPMLIVWGRNDQIFPAAGAEPYKRDLKTLEFHLLDAGHFALESNGDLIARLMRDFLGRHVAARAPGPNQQVRSHAGRSTEDDRHARLPRRLVVVLLWIGGMKCTAGEAEMLERTNASLWQQWAPLPLRLMIGYGFMAHGWAKLSRGPAGFANLLEQIHAPLPEVTAWVSTLIEILGGLAILAGALVTAVSVPLIVMMLVAMFTVHLRYGFSAINTIGLTADGPQFSPPGYEVNLLYIAALLALILGGAGPFSIDRLLARRKGEPAASPP